MIVLYILKEQFRKKTLWARNNIKSVTKEDMYDLKTLAEAVGLGRLQTASMKKIGENSTLGREPTNEVFFLRCTRDLLLPKSLSMELDVEGIYA